MARTKLGSWLAAGMGILMLTAPFSETMASESKRQKAIDFDDQVIEGMNRRPLDSLQQDADARDPRKHSL